MFVDTPRAKVVLRYGVCSIAVGAKDVLNTFQSELRQKNIVDVEVKLTGCIGLCSMEPLLDISMDGLPTVTYCLVTPEMVSGIVFHHILNKTIIQEWLISNY